MCTAAISFFQNSKFRQFTKIGPIQHDGAVNKKSKGNALHHLLDFIITAWPPGLIATYTDKSVLSSDFHC